MLSCSEVFLAFENNFELQQKFQKITYNKKLYYIILRNFYILWLI